MSKSNYKDVIKDIEKTIGVGAIATKNSNKGVEFQSTGIMSYDLALGGGHPKGRIIEIYGPESSGKTTLALHAIIQTQKDGKRAAFVDAEHAFDPFYAKNLGMLGTDFESGELLFSQPDNGEQALEIIDKLLNIDDLGIIVVDSVAALTPKSEIDGDFGDSKMGLHARLMSQAMRKLIAKISKSGCVVIFINQLRMKIGVLFGNPETQTGGNALKFYASQRIDVRKSTTNKDKDTEEALSNLTKVKIVKNKVFPPFRKCEFDIEFGTGVDIVGDMMNVAVDLEIIKKAGSWFSYSETRLGQGRDAAKTILKDNPELVEEITEKIYKELSK
jgi:recombination protein RecA